MTTDIKRLIECVKRHEILYDLSHEHNKNIALKNQVWNAIGQELNQSGDAVKSKWKTLRDGYTKYKKHLKDTGGVGKRNKYVWSSMLKFLDDYNHTRTSKHTDKEVQLSVSPTSLLDFQSTTNRGDPPENPPDYMQQINTMPLIEIPLAFRDTTKRSFEDDEDDLPASSFKKKVYDGIDFLFLSYADTFKKLPVREQAFLKIELAKLFANTELKLLRESHPTVGAISDQNPSSIVHNSHLHQLLSRSNNFVPAENMEDHRTSSVYIKSEANIHN